MNPLHWLKRDKSPALPRTFAAADMGTADESGVADLLERLNALAASGKTEDAEPRVFAVQHYVAILKHMTGIMAKTAEGMRTLSVQAAHGAAHLDPNALGRILDRMDSLGDATMRQIEGRIGLMTSREDRKNLQNLRDEMRTWLDTRDAHLQDAQLAVDELSVRTSEVREDLLAKSERLAKAADITALAVPSDREASRHVSAEAEAFSRALREFLLGTRF